MRQRLCGIYRITNILNGASYIGSSINVNARLATHRRQLNTGKHRNGKLMRAWNKYGAENFSFDIVEYVNSKDKILSREQYWINVQIKSGFGFYNIALVAGNTLGVRISEETKKKISEAKLGWRWDEESKKRMSEQRKGRAHSEDAKKKISEARLGKKHSEEARAKIAEANRRRWAALREERP